MHRPTKIIVSLTIVFVGLFIFFFSRLNKSGSQAVNYAAQVEDFKAHGVPGFHLPLFNLNRGVLEGSLGLDAVHSSVVLVNFWASWCEPCKAEFPSLVKLAEKYADGDKLTVVAISLDKDLNALNAFFDAMAPRPSVKNFIVLVDNEFSVPRRFGTKKVPETFVLNKQHQLVMKVIDEQNWLGPEFISFIDKSLATP